MDIPAAFTTSLKGYLYSLYARNVSSHTITAYHTDLTQFFTLIAETDITVAQPAQISRSHIIEYLSHPASAGRSGVTRVWKLASIREYYKFLTESGAIPSSPAASISMPKKERKSRVFLSVDEYMRLLNAAAGISCDYAILQLFLQTGLLVAELAGLQLSDIDLDAGCMLINGKGKKQRTIYLEKKASQALIAWLADRLRSGDQHLFLNYQGTGVSIRGVMDVVEKYRKEAGISKGFSCHSLRYTCATYKASKGYTPTELQDLLGHEKPETSVIYVHMARDARQLMQQTSL